MPAYMGTIFTLLFAITFMIVMMKLSTKLAILGRVQAPPNLREASNEDKEYFINNYILVGRVYNNKYLEELKEISKNLMVTDGKIVEINRSRPRGRYYAVISVEVDSNRYCQLNISFNKTIQNYKVLTDYWLGHPARLYCAPDKNGIYRIITTQILVEER